MYGNRINYLLSEYQYRFTTRYAQLSKLVETPVAQWASVHEMPSDHVAPFPFALYNNNGENAGPLKHFTVTGKKVLSNETTLFCQYRIRPAEAEWPPHFYQFAIIDLAAYLALPITRDTEKAKHWTNIARGTPSEGGKGGMFRSVTMADAMAKPGEKFEDFSLIEARQGYTPTR